MTAFDYEKLTSEFLREIRGRRSQTVFSRRVGYRSNVAYAWEAGHAWPTASRLFQILERTGVDVEAALRRFYRTPPSWMHAECPNTREGVASLLDDLRGTRTIVDVSEASGVSRFSVSRWLSGETEPRVPDFFRLLETTSLRLLDFISCFVDPARLPSVANAWERLEAGRRAAYDVPWSQAVLRVLELEEYRALACHIPGSIASRLGIPERVETESLALLERTGQITWDGHRWVLGEALTIDTRRDPDRALAAKAFWARAAAERVTTATEGTFSYNVFSVSKEDLGRIQELHRAFFRELRAIVAQSEPAECVALASVNLLELGGERRSD